MSEENNKHWMLTPVDVLMGKLWDRVSVFFTIGFQSVWSGFLEFWPKLLAIGLNNITDFYSKLEPEAWDNLLRPFIQMGYITDEQATELKKMKDLMHPYDLVMYLRANFNLFNSLMNVNLEPGQMFMSQKMMKDHRPGLPSPNDIIRAAFVAPEKTGEVKEVLKKHGLPDEMIDMLFISNYRLYDMEEIKVLWLRGVLSDDDMFMRMRELGFTDTRTKELIQGWSIIPGPQDLFFLVGKEAFEPDSIALMGLADEFPEEQVQWLQKQGVSREWALKYWYAHWDQPSIQAGYEMLHRGVIGLDELNLLFRTVEIPPFWRDKLTKIAYQPYTRVDVRRMHDMGVLDDEQLLKSYMDLGYDLEHAENMSLFTVRYNQQNDKELTKSEILKGYNERALVRSDAIELLINLGYTEDLADYVLTFEDYKESKSLQDDMIDNIRDRFQMNLTDLQTTESLLNGLNLPDAQIKLLLDKWEIKRFKARKVPSKDDLRKFLRNDIIDIDTFRQEMTRLGYDYNYSEWYEKLYLIPKAL